MSANRHNRDQADGGPPAPPDLQSSILDSIGEGVFTVDEEGRITSFNRAAEELTGFGRDEALGLKCHDVFRADICQTSCALRHTLETGEPVRGRRVTVLDRQMNAVPVSVSTALLRDDDGAVLGGVEIMRDISDLERLRRDLEGRHVFEDIVGRSASMRALFGLLPDVARAEVPVLIEGPSGSGKELVAQAIHRLSPRAAGPFVTINCGALPDSLLESELFGHRKGAFTGAVRDYDGRFVAADGGTLLLDEVGDTSPAFQVKLLRALQEGEVRPLGATESLHVDVRVLAATHRDLAAMVREGGFREDLYYRLRVIPIRLPALAERREDIPLLAEHVLRRVATRRGVDVAGFSAEAMRALVAHTWPGNVRELENAIDHALVMCRGAEIEREHLPPEVLGAHAAALTPTPEGLGGAAVDERRRILAALEGHRWNRNAAARALGLSRTTLWRRMRQLDID